MLSRMSVTTRTLLPLAASLTLLAGCGSTHATPTAAGSHGSSGIRSVYTPRGHCARVETQARREDRDLGLEIRVVCLSGSGWDHDLVEACRAEPRAVPERFRLYDAATGKTRAVTCEELHGPVPPGF
jgi:hypothetical protein